MSEDFYHDDPVEEIPRKSPRTLFVTSGAFIFGLLLFQGTFAGNISLNSGTGVEFGQGVSQAVACSGNRDLTMTPRSTFTNGSPGRHYLNSVTVSNIPDSCFGVDFTINAFNDTGSTPLALFNSVSTSAVVYNNNGTFSRGAGSSGMTVTGNSGTFTVTFTTPVAQSSELFKLTIQSGLHKTFYDLGFTGPGAGLIYYVDIEGFNCGATFTNVGSPTGGLCHYLEVAPSGWNGGDDPFRAWSYIADAVPGIINEPTPNNSRSVLGLGYMNSIAIVAQGNGVPYAAGVARAYAGGSKNDWYLPNAAELNLLCQWGRGVASDPERLCTSGNGLNSATFGAQSAGLALTIYQSSSQQDATGNYVQAFSALWQYNYGSKSIGAAVRPIRAF